MDKNIEGYINKYIELLKYEINDNLKVIIDPLALFSIEFLEDGDDSSKIYYIHCAEIEPCDIFNYNPISQYIELSYIRIFKIFRITVHFQYSEENHIEVIAEDKNESIPLINEIFKEYLPVFSSILADLQMKHSKISDDTPLKNILSKKTLNLINQIIN